MESVYQHCRNKIVMNCAVVWGEHLKCFVRFSRPLHNLKFGQITSLSKRGLQRNVPKCNARVGRAELLFLLIKPIVLWRSRSRHRRPYLRSGSLSNDNGEGNENVILKYSCFEKGCLKEA